MYDPMDPKITMLIWGTGASFGLTLFRSDFIDYVQCEIPIGDVPKVNKVIGIGMTLQKFTDVKGLPVYLPCISYHTPKTDVYLFSPQMYHQMHGGYLEVYGNCIRMLLKTSTINIQIMREKHILPVVFDSFISMLAKKALATTMCSGLCHTHLNILNFFHDNDLDDLGSFLAFGITNLKISFISVVYVWEHQPMRIFLDLRRNFLNGIGSWTLACIAFFNLLCVSIIMKNRRQEDYSSCYNQAKVCYGSKLCCSPLSIVSPVRSREAFPEGFADADP
jgi:hypothetical protein